MTTPSRHSRPQHTIQPPPTVIRQTPPSSWGTSDNHNSLRSQNGRPRPPGLILDASGTKAASTPPLHAIDRGRHATAGRIRPRQAMQQTPHEGRFVTPQSKQEASEPSARSAVTLARQQNAPLFGYLQKQGSNVPVLKRRFFVLQPGTVLYYFLAPTDTEPRGCLDLEGSWIESQSGNPNQFSICWEDGTRVVLEARSPELAEQWRDGLQHERLSVAKAALAKQKRLNSALQSRVKELEATVDNYRLVEQDRDGALEDAAMWKERFHQLDDSLKMLTGQLRKYALKDGESKKSPESEEKGELSEEKKDDDFSSANRTKHGIEKAPTENSGIGIHDSSTDENATARDQSLVDNDEDANDSLDFTDVPGSYFSGLQNTCDQLMENHRLAAIEAATAIEDLNAVNEQLVSKEKRMAKAEKQLCKLWEENCTMRKAMKQKRREKTVLVREVKSLLEAAQVAEKQKSYEEKRVDSARDNDHGDEVGSDEEKLINELEDHLMSSIRMHEKFLATGKSGQKKNDTDPEPPSQAIECSAIKQPDTPFDATLQPRSGGATPQCSKGVFQKNLLSLFDESSDEGSVSSEANRNEDDSSLQVELSENEEERRQVETSAIELNSFHSSNVSPNRPNPLEELDDEDEEMPSAQDSISSRSAISSKCNAGHGEATSKLSCPLVDVVETSSKPKVEDDDSSRELNYEELQVYHLTFYSRKIGLQFQKVPPPPLKAKGLLTAALTADLHGNISGAETTAADLRRVAAFSKNTGDRGDRSATTGSHDQCVVATPIDAVLVCGFEGFDDTGSNARPKLGARLVAFDGVSVEVGKWTFDSIRKSIQSRGRPLTLSFRNDFLTTEQRQILTLATTQGSNKPAPPQSQKHKRSAIFTPPMRNGLRGSQDTASVHSALSTDTDPTHVASAGASTPRSDYHDDDRSLSAAGGSDHRYSVTPHSFSASRSVSSNGIGGKSFSEAGSSVSVLSAVGPLVSNLLGKREPFTPEYLQREPEAVEDTPQHQDFKSELL